MGLAKRTMDIVVGTALAIVCLPIMVVTAIIAAISLRCWPLFVQERVGRNGRMFSMVKIRTLPPQAPRYASKYELSEVHIPKATAMLRRLHLDELPQLLLVPTGRMSLVGPRPEMQVLYEEFDSYAAKLRTSVRPGCTGLWQVSPRAEGLIPESPEFDEFYLEHHTIRLDVWILWRTFGLMVLHRKPAALEAIPEWTFARRRHRRAEERARRAEERSQQPAFE